MRKILIFSITFTIAILYLYITLSFGEWGVLSIELGEENKENGIIERDNGTSGDGITQADKIGDKECKVVSKTPPGQGNVGNHIYFIVDPTVVPDKAKTSELWIAVEFFDSAKGASGILLDYDNEGDVYPDQAFALDVPQNLRMIEFTYTEEWKIGILHVEDAEFKKQGNSADFRYHIVDYMSDDFYVHKVWVSDQELTLEELGASKAVSSQDKMAITWAKLKNK